jgi:hypothetical protein
MISREVCLVVLLCMSGPMVQSSEPASGKLDRLIKNSPFGQPASTTGAQAGNEVSPLEFRGVLVEKGEYFFSLYEPAVCSGQWVRLKEIGQPYVVESYDGANGSIQVKYRNQVMTLTLNPGQIIVQAAPSIIPTTAVSPPTSAVSPTSSEESLRLAHVAGEIRRRLALVPRQQVTNTSAPGQPPTLMTGPISSKP